PAGEWWRCRCPSHGGMSLALRDTPRGLIIHCHAGCRRDDVLAALRGLGLVDDAGTRRSASPCELEQFREAQATKRRRRIKDALWLWENETQPAAGTLVERYLNSRSLWLPVPNTIRMSRSWWRHQREGGARPCMVGLVEHVDHGPI